MSGGGKGGSQSTSNSVPKWVEDPAKRNLARAEEISQIGYTPFMGPDVAAFTPQQMAAFGNTGNMASAYGLASGGVNMPEPQTYAGGVQGYSSYPLYQQSVDALQSARPGQYDAIMNQFIDPYTGASPIAATAQTTSTDTEYDKWLAMQRGDTDHGGGNPTGQFGGFGGYSGFGDMFDGGGPGQSGGSFQGGGVASSIGNAAGGPGGIGGGLK